MIGPHAILCSAVSHYDRSYSVAMAGWQKGNLGNQCCERHAYLVLGTRRDMIQAVVSSLMSRDEQRASDELQGLDSWHHIFPKNQLGSQAISEKQSSPQTKRCGGDKPATFEFRRQNSILGVGNHSTNTKQPTKRTSTSGLLQIMTLHQDVPKPGRRRERWRNLQVATGVFISFHVSARVKLSFMPKTWCGSRWNPRPRKLSGSTAGCAPKTTRWWKHSADDLSWRDESLPTTSHMQVPTKLFASGVQTCRGKHPCAPLLVPTPPSPSIPSLGDEHHPPDQVGGPPSKVGRLAVLDRHGKASGAGFIHKGGSLSTADFAAIRAVAKAQRGSMAWRVSLDDHVQSR